MIVISSIIYINAISEQEENTSPQNILCFFYRPGDVNSNNRTDGIDVVYFVAFLHGGAPPPHLFPGPFYPTADANGDCYVNGLDVVYLVNYFRGGPAPSYCPDYIPCPF